MFDSKKSLSQLTVFILAGGLGTRLRSVVQEKPKVLAEVAGRPFLTYVLDQIRQGGFSHVTLCTGFKGEMLRTLFGANYLDLSLNYSEEKKPLGTGGALRLAIENIASPFCLVMNGDSFVDVCLKDFWEWYSLKKNAAGIVATQVKDVSRFGRIHLDEGEIVQEFEEKGAHQGAGLINAGMYIFSRDFLLSLPKEKPFSLEKDVFPKMVEGKKLVAFPCNGRFIDIGTPESFIAAQTFFGGK